MRCRLKGTHERGFGNPYFAVYLSLRHLNRRCFGFPLSGYLGCLYLGVRGILRVPVASDVVCEAKPDTEANGTDCAPFKFEVDESMRWDFRSCKAGSPPIYSNELPGEFTSRSDALAWGNHAFE